LKPFQSSRTSVQLAGQFGGHRQHRRTILASEGAHADDDQHRMLRVLELVEEAQLAVDEFAQRGRPGAQPLDRIGQVFGRADAGDRAPAADIALADAGIQHRRFERGLVPISRMASACVDAGDGRVEQVAAARAGLDLRPVLAAVELGEPSGPSDP
jgi:hypothetical protein